MCFHPPVFNTHFHFVVPSSSPGRSKTSSLPSSTKRFIYSAKVHVHSSGSRCFYYIQSVILTLRCCFYIQTKLTDWFECMQSCNNSFLFNVPSACFHSCHLYHLRFSHFIVNSRSTDSHCGPRWWQRCRQSRTSPSPRCSCREQEHRYQVLQNHRDINNTTNGLYCKHLSQVYKCFKGS